MATQVIWRGDDVNGFYTSHLVTGTGRHTQEGDYGIAETVQNLAKHLKLETIAEGVETPEQHRKLLALGCEDGQGYLFSKPLTEQDFEQFLRKSFD